MDVDGLFHSLYPSLFRYLQRLTGDPDMADDVAQESFVRLLRQSLPEDEVRPWLFAVATNLVRDRARKVQRHQRLQRNVPRASTPPNPETAVARAERIDAVRQALDELSARDRRMLLMREEGFKYAEIAAAVGVAPGSVGTLLARASRRFAQVYGTLNAQDVET